MAIRGNAYPKTAWAFQERPVASSKLNTWDDRIESALELAYFLLSHAWGGGNGVLRGVASELEVVETDPVGLSVRVLPGYAFIDHHVYRLAQPAQTPDVTPPSALDRIDLVQARIDTWDITVKTGAEAAEPEPPEPDSGAIPIAHLHLRPGMTSIKEVDDSVNGYIVDGRPFL